MEYIRKILGKPRVISMVKWLIFASVALLLMQDTGGFLWGQRVLLKILPATETNPDVVRLSISSFLPKDVRLQRQMKIWQGKRVLRGPFRTMSLTRASGEGSYFISKVVMLLPYRGVATDGSTEYQAWVPRSVPSWFRWLVYLAFVIGIVIPKTWRYFRDQPLKEGKLLHLEALRGLACFIVVMTHYAQMFYPNLSVEDVASKRWYEPEALYHWIPFASLVSSGSFAVDTFFVLSGFVLYLPFCGLGAGRATKVATAVLRRPVRLYGILVAVMLACYLLRIGGWPFGAFFTPPLTLRGFLYDLVTAYESSTKYNLAFWTIHYELIGSMGVYAFAFLLGGNRWRWAGYLAALVVLHDSLYSDFLFGMILADGLKSHAEFKMPAWGRFLPTVLLLLGLTAGICSVAPEKMTRVSIWLTHTLPDPKFLLAGSYGTIGAVLVIAAVLLSPSMQRMLSIRSLTAMGRLSYSTYGIHGLVLTSLTAWWMMLLHPNVANAKFTFEPDGISYHVSAGLSLAFYLVFVLIFSAALTAFVDEPCVSLSRSILKNRTGKSPEKTTSVSSTG